MHKGKRGVGVLITMKVTLTLRATASLRVRATVSLRERGVTATASDGDIRGANPPPAMSVLRTVMVASATNVTTAGQGAEL